MTETNPEGYKTFETADGERRVLGPNEQKIQPLSAEEKQQLSTAYDKVAQLHEYADWQQIEMTDNSQCEQDAIKATMIQDVAVFFSQQQVAIALKNQAAANKLERGYLQEKIQDLEKQNAALIKADIEQIELLHAQQDTLELNVLATATRNEAAQKMAEAIKERLDFISTVDADYEILYSALLAWNEAKEGGKGEIR